MNDLFEVLEATWPPAETARTGPWKLRRGLGGGKRVSAATLDGGIADPASAEAQMRDWNQSPLFQVRQDQEALDQTLAARGYGLVDPTVILTAPLATLPDWFPNITAIYCQTPLSSMEEIWAGGGIGPGRLAIMQRAEQSKTWILGRLNDRPAACAFAAIHDGTAMLHALEVSPPARRNGLGRIVTLAAAHWARIQGATTFALAVTEANQPALTLYQSLGMSTANRYHYRLADSPKP